MAGTRVRIGGIDPYNNRLSVDTQFFGGQLVSIESSIADAASISVLIQVPQNKPSRMRANVVMQRAGSITASLALGEGISRLYLMEGVTFSSAGLAQTKRSLDRRDISQPPSSVTVSYNPTLTGQGTTIMKGARELSVILADNTNYALQLSNISGAGGDAKSILHLEFEDLAEV